MLTRYKHQMKIRIFTLVAVLLLQLALGAAFLANSDLVTTDIESKFTSHHELVVNTIAEEFNLD